jgi:hypothetical protein
MSMSDTAPLDPSLPETKEVSPERAANKLKFELELEVRPASFLLWLTAYRYTDNLPVGDDVSTDHPIPRQSTLPPRALLHWLPRLPHLSQLPRLPRLLGTARLCSIRHVRSPSRHSLSLLYPSFLLVLTVTTHNNSSLSFPRRLVPQTRPATLSASIIAVFSSSLNSGKRSRRMGRSW